MTDLAKQQQVAATKARVLASLKSPELRKWLASLAGIAAVGAAKGVASKMALSRARKINEREVNRATADKLPQLAARRYGINPTIVRSDNAVTRLVGPVYSPKENEIVGPTNESRAKGKRVGTLDEPAVLAHELGHAAVAKKTPRISRHAPKIRPVTAGLATAAALKGSPILASLLSAAGSVPGIIEERRANMHAKKLLVDAVGKKRAKEMMRSNHIVEGVGIGSAAVSSLMAALVARRVKAGRSIMAKPK